jgi:ABC-type multidrug transport system, ATPase component
MIAYESVAKKYSNGRGLSRLDLELGPGVHGIAGRNGAGKTTALKLLIGLLSPDSGRVTIDGRDIGEGDGYSFRRAIGYCPSEDYFFPYLSGRRNLEYVGYLRRGDKRAYEACLDAVEALEIGGLLDEPFSSYSTGTRKKIQLVGSIVGDPEILIWDEPNNGVDLMANIYIRELLARQGRSGKTVLLSSHVLEFMGGLVDSISILEEGSLAARAAPAPENLRSFFLGAIGRGGE